MAADPGARPTLDRRAALHQVLQELQAQYAAEVARLTALVAAGRDRLQLIRDALDAVAGDMQRGGTAREAALQS